MILVRKDKAINGTDDNPHDALQLSNDPSNCAQANDGLVPTGAPGVQNEQRDNGGVLVRGCSTFANGCNPSTCTFKDTSDPNYHQDCRMETAFNLVGMNDTIHSDRHPWNQPYSQTNAPPNAPPWFTTLNDDHTVTSPNSVSGQNQAVVSYEETGTYYVSACAQVDGPSPMPFAP